MRPLLPRAVREAMCLAKLDHPNVVRYHQVWKEEVEESALEQFLDSSDEEDSSSLSLSLAIEGAMPSEMIGIPANRSRPGERESRAATT